MSETALFERKYKVYIAQAICAKLLKKENRQKQCNFFHKLRNVNKKLKKIDIFYTRF